MFALGFQLGYGAWNCFRSEECLLANPGELRKRFSVPSDGAGTCSTLNFDGRDVEFSTSRMGVGAFTYVGVRP